MNNISPKYIATSPGTRSSVIFDSTMHMGLDDLYAMCIKFLVLKTTNKEVISFFIKRYGLVIDSRTAHILLKVDKISQGTMYSESDIGFRKDLLRYMCTKTVRVRLEKDN